MEIKAISLWQPYATALALGLKRNETRLYPTRHHGILGIHAAQKKSAAQRELFEKLMGASTFCTAMRAAGYCTFDDLPFGALVATGDLCGCLATAELNVRGLPALERELGDYRRGRHAWSFGKVTALAQPHPCCGKQGFFFLELPERLLTQK